MNYVAIAGRLIRTLRAERSQMALSRWLGYKSNVIYSWEKGLKHPKASDAFCLARKVGVDLQDALGAFWSRRTVAALHNTKADTRPKHDDDLATDAGVQRFIQREKGNIAITDLAEHTGFSRFTISRWLSGESAPKLHQLLAFIDASSGRLVDFVSVLVPIEKITELTERARQIDLQRQIAREMPQTQAVLLGLETLTLRTEKNVEPMETKRCEAAGITQSNTSEINAEQAIDRSPTDTQPFQQPTLRSTWYKETVNALSQRIGLTCDDVGRALSLLEECDMIRPDDARQAYELRPQQIIDTTSMPEAADAMRRWVHQIGEQRRCAGNPGLFAYNVFSVSNETLTQLRDLQLAYFQQMRSLIANDAKEERVVVANLQLFALDNQPLL